MSFLTKGLRENLPHVAIAVAGKDCRIRASNDVEAIERWLDEYFEKPATFRAYKKEAERFLVWCNRERAKNLSNINREDIAAYINFLQNPRPREFWCGPRRGKRVGARSAWYPFAGPLGESAIKTAISCLTSMMSYLADARYIDFNPFLLVRRKSGLKRNLQEQRLLVHERILSDAEWQALLKALEDEPELSDVDIRKKNRIKFLLTILFFLGLRIDELSRAVWSDCRKINEKWWFFVKGKGDRLAKIPINSHLLSAMMRYRLSDGTTPLPAPEDNAPLIHALCYKQKALTARQMSNLIKQLALKAAESFPEGSSSRKKLMFFSPHWLRHLSASKQDLAGISFTNIKSNLRHQNEQTTRIYVHAYDDHRHDEMEKLTM